MNSRISLILGVRFGLFLRQHHEVAGCRSGQAFHRTESTDSEHPPVVGIRHPERDLPPTISLRRGRVTQDEPRRFLRRRLSGPAWIAILTASRRP